MRTFAEFKTVDAFTPYAVVAACLEQHEVVER